jgi:hypothetical protein
MRRRMKPVQVYLSEDEFKKFEQRVQLCGLTQSAYIRKLLDGEVPQPVQPAEYMQLMNELSGLKTQLAELRDNLAIRGQAPTAEQLESLRQEMLEQMRNINNIVYYGTKPKDMV